MSRSDRPWLAWILVTVGGVAVALATLEAASGASEANGKWQEAVRAQTGYTAATVSNARKVYVDEAPLALAINAGLIRAEELERRAGDDPALRVQARAERAAAEKYLRRFRAAQGPINELIASDRYVPGASVGAPQLGQRLAALQAAEAGLAADVGASLAAAEHAERRVTLAGWGIAAGAAVALLGFVLWWRRRSSAPAPKPEPETASEPRSALADWSSPLPAGRAAAVPVGQSPAGQSAAAVPSLLAIGGVALFGLRARRRGLVGLVLGVLVGVMLRRAVSAASAHPPALAGPEAPAGPPAAAIAPIPAAPSPPAAAGPEVADRPSDPEPPEVAFAPRDLPAVPANERGATPLPAIVLGLIAAVVTAGQIQAGVAESRLLADAARRADVVAGAVAGGLIRQTFADNGRQSGLLLGQRADDLAEAGGDPAQAAANNAASARIQRLAADMGVQPRAEDGLDAFTVTVVSGLEIELASMRADQQRAAEAADNAGGRSDRLVIVLFALTLAASLAEIGRSLSTGRPGVAVRWTGYAVAGVAALYALALTLLT